MFVKLFFGKIGNPGKFFQKPPGNHLTRFPEFCKFEFGVPVKLVGFHGNPELKFVRLKGASANFDVAPFEPKRTKGLQMTVAELKKMSDEQLGDVFAKMPEPSFRSPINTETKTMEQILDDFSKCEASAEDWAAMHGDVASLV